MPTISCSEDGDYWCWPNRTLTASVNVRRVAVGSQG